ncbi:MULTISPECIES: hypothetical protein [unclassified Carboxylicivirga]|uniref:hypothetical protein n=1 Tax=Carboxylicivirga TaxID=1628153 RepID=UPI003D348B9B
MKKIFIAYSLFLLFISFSVNAQDVKFGFLQPEELQIKECDFEEDAPAVVLFDKGNSWFVQEVDGFVLRFDRHVRIKIFNEAAFDQGEFEIALYRTKEGLEKLKQVNAFTFNHEDGILKKVALDPDQVYQEEINNNWYVKKFAMPQIKEGSIIDVQYSIYSPFYTHLRDWDFQTNIPTLYSEYKVNMIPFYSYRYRMQGTTKMDHFKSYKKPGFERTFANIPFKDMVYEFGMKNVPSFRDETFISSRNDYIIKIDFQMSEINYPSGYTKTYMNTWPSLAEEMLDHDDFGKYLKRSEKWADKNLSYLAEMAEEERLGEVLNYMKTNYKWNEYYGKYAQYSLKEFNENNTGNIGNINLCTIGALRSVGLQAFPVIVSTRDNGKVTDSFPYSNLFNYVLVLVEVDGRVRLVDATQSMCPNHLIPARCINGKGFVVKEDSESWVTIANSATSLEEINLSLHLDVEENQLAGLCKAKSTGYMALANRSGFHNDKEKFKRRIAQKGLTIKDEIEPDNLYDKALPFKYSFEFSQSIDRVDNQLIISPFANLTQNDNPFKQENRSLPIDMVYRQGYRYITTIQVPKGYRIEELPTQQKINSDNVAFNFVVTEAEGSIQIIASYNFKKQSYLASDYRELKNFMNTVASKINTKIILIEDEELAEL